MKTNIESLVNCSLEDNKEYIKESGCSTIAEYLKSSLNEESDYIFYLKEDECEFGVTKDQEEEVKNWIDENYSMSIEYYFE